MHCANIAEGVAERSMSRNDRSRVYFAICDFARNAVKIRSDYTFMRLAEIYNVANFGRVIVTLSKCTRAFIPSACDDTSENVKRLAWKLATVNLTLMSLPVRFIDAFSQNDERASFLSTKGQAYWNLYGNNFERASSSSTDKANARGRGLKILLEKLINWLRAL